MKTFFGFSLLTVPLLSQVALADPSLDRSGNRNTSQPSQRAPFESTIDQSAASQKQRLGSSEDRNGGALTGKAIGGTGGVDDHGRGSLVLPRDGTSQPNSDNKGLSGANQPGYPGTNSGTGVGAGGTGVGQGSVGTGGVGSGGTGVGR